MFIRENQQLKAFNTFHINVNAARFIEVTSEDEAREVCPSLKDMQFLILGGGSNMLLMNDLDTVIKISISGIDVISEDANSALIKAGAGVPWNDVVSFAVERNLGGIENLVLIPGTTGAAPIQNIGAYGQELKDTFYSLDAVDIKTCSLRTFSKEECQFGYRSSVFKNKYKNQYIITSVSLRLQKNPTPEISYSSVKSIIEREGIKNYSISDISRIIAGIRRSKLPDPDQVGNAGSFFKNPEINADVYELLRKKHPAVAAFKSTNNKMKIAAGWLIEQCGWKGKREGDAGSHKDQALVIVNYGNASGKDILDFAEKIKISVFEKFGIELEEEVNIINP